MSTPLDLVVDAVTLNPFAARSYQRAVCRFDEGSAVQAVVDGYVVVCDETVELGGTGAGPTPIGLILSALGSGYAITYQQWALRLGVRFESLSVTVTAELDLRGRLGVDDRVRPGMRSVEVDVALRGSEHPARYEALRRAAEAHCPVLDGFRTPVPWCSSLHVDRTDGLGPPPSPKLGSRYGRNGGGNEARSR